MVVNDLEKLCFTFLTSPSYSLLLFTALYYYYFLFLCILNKKIGKLYI